MKTYIQLPLSPGAAPEQTPVKLPLSPGAAPEQKLSRQWQPSGWLDMYKVTRYGRHFWYWRYCWRDSSGKIRHKHVTSAKLPGLRDRLARWAGIEDILNFLKSAQS